MVNSTAKIFWSWQNDYSPKCCRRFIREALAKAITHLANETSVHDADRPEIDHDTRGERGMADIAATILKKIEDAAVFVADLTPIAQSPAGKWLPNPNVMIELGWAMHKPGWDRVIGILNVASGAKVEDLPFDIRQRRIITFELAEDADKPTRAGACSKLVKELEGALRTNLEERAEEVAAATEITGVPANVDNPSIWASARETLVHNDAFGEARRQQVMLPDVPRSYMRIIPAGWNNDIPTVSDIAGLHQSDSVGAPMDGATDGDFGATEEGYVRYWISNRVEAEERLSYNMTMFFEDTGEFWMLHGSVITEHDGQILLAARPMLGQWSRTLREAMGVMDRFGAKRARRVEAGLFGVKDVHWASRFRQDRAPSRRNETRKTRQSSDWTPAAQLAFVTNSYNGVRNLFALGPSTEDEIRKILQEYDPDRFRNTDRH